MLESRLRAVRWIVKGRVQGVSFRYFTEQAARELELTGWVQNLTDGSVEVQVAGDEMVLERLRQRLLEGPRFAAVDDIGEDPLDPDQLVRDLGHRGFEIRW
ncbi:MAG: acylphosphatase [bacterium]|nr:acylphosphatase [bacterium]